MSRSIAGDFFDDLDPRREFAVIQEKLDQLLARVEQSSDDDGVREWFSVEETAKQLALASWTVRNYCRTGRIRAEKLANGRDWRIAKNEIRRYKEQGPPPEWDFSM